MANILHRLAIGAPPERVHQLTATREGTEQLWTGRPVAGDEEVGRQAAYRMSLKSGAEGDGFNAYPGGEISRWD